MEKQNIDRATEETIYEEKGNKVRRQCGQKDESSKTTPEQMTKKHEKRHVTKKSGQKKARQYESQAKHKTANSNIKARFNNIKARIQ